MAQKHKRSFKKSLKKRLKKASETYSIGMSKPVVSQFAKQNKKDVREAQAQTKDVYPQVIKAANSSQRKRLKVKKKLKEVFEKPLVKGFNDPVKEEFNFQGLPICIEWKEGEARKYGKNKSQSGKIQKANYGYIKNTIAPDQGAIDVYLKKDGSDKVFLLLQKPIPGEKGPAAKDFEEKYMLGFNSADEAVKAYKGSMPAKFFESIKEIPLKDLKLKAKLWKPSVKEVAKALRKAVGNPDRYNEVGGYAPNAIGFSDNMRKSKDNVKKGKKQLQGVKNWEKEIANSQEALKESLARVKKKGLAKAIASLKKDIMSLPAQTAYQGDKTLGPAYSFDKSADKKVKVKKMKRNLDKAYTGPSYFEQVKEVVPANSWESEPYESLPKKLKRIKKSGPFGSPPFDEVGSAAPTYWEQAKYDRRPYRERDGKINPKIEKLFKRFGDVQKAIDRINKKYGHEDQDSCQKLVIKL